MKMEILPVLMHVNKLYEEEAIITLSSLINSNPNLYLDIFLVKDKSMRASAFKELKSRNVRIRCGSLKLYISKIIRSYQTVLYLSKDLIVFSSMEELLHHPMGNYPLAAVPYLCNEVMQRYIRNIGFSKDEIYYNTDLMLINVKTFLENAEDFVNQLEADRKKGILLNAIINKYFVNKISSLEYCWNYPWAPVYANTRNEFLIADDMEKYKECRNLKVINYTGLYSPRDKLEFPQISYYWRCVKGTPYYHVYLEVLAKQRNMQIYRMEQLLEKLIAEND